MTAHPDPGLAAAPARPIVLEARGLVKSYRGADGDLRVKVGPVAQGQQRTKR